MFLNELFKTKTPKNGSMGIQAKVKIDNVYGLLGKEFFEYTLYKQDKDTGFWYFEGSDLIDIDNPPKYIEDEVIIGKIESYNDIVNNLKKQLERLSYEQIAIFNLTGRQG